MTVSTVRPLRALALASVLAAVVLVASANGTTDTDSTETWPVSTEQVERGRTVYAQSCAVCHGADLEGMAHFPALADAAFRTRWAERTLGELFTYTHDLMPLGAGGSLTVEAYTDVTAYMLERNGVEHGDVDFDPEDEEHAAQQLADLW